MSKMNFVIGNKYKLKRAWTRDEYSNSYIGKMNPLLTEFSLLISKGTTVAHEGKGIQLRFENTDTSFGYPIDSKFWEEEKEEKETKMSKYKVGDRVYIKAGVEYSGSSDDGTSYLPAYGTVLNMDSINEPVFVRDVKLDNGKRVQFFEREQKYITAPTDTDYFYGEIIEINCLGWETRKYIGKSADGRIIVQALRDNFPSEGSAKVANVAFYNEENARKLVVPEPPKRCEVTLEQIADKFHISLDRLSIVD